MASTTPAQRKNLFRFVCIPIRLLFAWLAVLIAKENDADATASWILCIVLILMSAGMFYRALEQCTSMQEDGVQLGGLGGPVWWSWLRFVHIAIFVSAVVLIQLEVNYGAAVLFASPAIGLVASTVLQPTGV